MRDYGHHEDCPLCILNFNHKECGCDFCKEGRGEEVETLSAVEPEPISAEEEENLRDVCREVLDAIHKIKWIVINTHPNAKRSEDMLPAPKVGGKKSQGGSRPQYLKAEHLDHQQAEFKVDKVVMEETEYSDCQVLGKIGETPYILGLRFNSKNFKILYDAFGADETKWGGKSFLVSPIYSETQQADILRVSTAPAKSAKR